MPRTGRPSHHSIVFLRWVLLALVATWSAGCGYRNMLALPTGEGGSAPTRIAVLSLRSDSPEPWINRVVSDSLRREIGLRGRFDLVSDPKRADYVIRGRILPMGLGSNSFSSFVVAIEYKLTLRLELEVLRKEGDVIRLPMRTLVESDIYLASQDVEVTRSNRLEALRHLSDVLATRVADSVEWIAFDGATSEGQPEDRPIRDPDALVPPPAGELGMLDRRTGRTQ